MKSHYFRAPSFFSYTVKETPEFIYVYIYSILYKGSPEKKDESFSKMYAFFVALSYTVEYTLSHATQKLVKIYLFDTNTRAKYFINFNSVFIKKNRDMA